MERKYSDLTSLEAFPTSAAYPTKVCLAGIPFNVSDWFSVPVG